MNYLFRFHLFASALGILGVGSSVAQDTLPQDSAEEQTIRPTSHTDSQEVARLSAQWIQLIAAIGGTGHLLLRRYANLESCNGSEVPDSLVLLTNTWPPQTATKYVFVEDSSGRVVAATDSTTDCREYWTNAYTYFFNASGRTSRFERYSKFTRWCEFGVARETSTYYYSTTGRILQKDYKMEDSAGTPERPSRCSMFEARDTYTVYGSWHAYAHDAKLPFHQ
jgi:hypothetical protein